MRYDGRAAFDGDGFQVHVGPNNPWSRGKLAINSSDPRAKPSIQFNYLQQSQDVQDWRDTGDEIQPGADIESDESIDRWVRRNVESAYHPSCTVKMGGEGDSMAVLDDQCQVRGVSALRVVDSSIFPSITNGNLNGPTIMVAERAADIIKGSVLPAEQSARTWIAEDWDSKQRSLAGIEL